MARLFLLAIAAAAVLAGGCGDNDGGATTSGENGAQTTGGDAMKEEGESMKSEGEAMKEEGESEGESMEKEYGGSKSRGAATQSNPGAVADASLATNRRQRARRRGRIVKVVRSQFGPVIADRRGEAVYLFGKESGKRSRCYGACAKAWPPLLTKGRPRARGGARARLLGVTRRKGGALQVTYRNHPVYYYKDDRPGLILCQGVAEFGGLWLVVKPNGRPVT